MTQEHWEAQETLGVVVVSERTHRGFTVGGEGTRAEDRGLTNTPVPPRRARRGRSGAGLRPLLGAYLYHSLAAAPCEGRALSVCTWRLLPRPPEGTWGMVGPATLSL